MHMPRQPATYRDPEIPTTDRRAFEIVVGDTITEPGRIALTATSVSPIIHGFVIVGYDLGDDIAGSRSYPALQVLPVRRAPLKGGGRAH